jgi:hypothetical protein
MSSRVKTNTLGTCALTFAAAALLVASCSTDYQPLESRAPVVREGGYGTRKVVDGVDIWTSGEPPRKYQVLGIINDERLQAPFEMARYYHDVAAKVKKAGGNGAIEVYSDSQITAIVSNSFTTSSGTVSGYGAGNVAFGQYSGSSNTTGFAAAQQHHSARFVVVKYL